MSTGTRSKSGQTSPDVTCLTKLWTYIKLSIASVVKVSSVVSHSSGSGCIALIVVAHVCVFLDVMTRGFLDRVQDRGHLVKATVMTSKFISFLFFI